MPIWQVDKVTEAKSICMKIHTSNNFIKTLVLKSYELDRLYFNVIPPKSVQSCFHFSIHFSVIYLNKATNSIQHKDPKPSGLPLAKP